MPIRVPRKPSDAYQHGNLREALVTAGLKLLAEGGVPNLSLRAAAQLAGVSHAAPYRHFRDKEALVAAIAQQGFHLLTEATRRELAKCASPDARDRLEALGRGYLGFALAHPAYLKVIFGGVVDKKSIPPELHAAGQESYGVLREVVAEGIARGELAGSDPDTVALACWSMVHGLSMLAIEKVTDPFTEGRPIHEVGANLLRLLRDGIGRPSVKRS